MRIILLLLFAMALSLKSFAQDFNNVLYLKNGSIIKGELIHTGLDNNFIIRTLDGRLLSFNQEDIEQILTEQNLNLSDYGSGFSFGISIGGGSIAGMPLRYHGSEKFAFEMSLNYRPGIIFTEDYWGNSETHFEHSFLFGIGTNYYIGKYFKEKKQKVKLNGISLKAGIGTGGFDSYLIGIGWINESYKKFNFNKSFNIELGPCYVFTDYRNSNEETYSGGTVAVYAKVQWNWFRK